MTNNPTSMMTNFAMPPYAIIRRDYVDGEVEVLEYFSNLRAAESVLDDYIEQHHHLDVIEIVDR